MRFAQADRSVHTAAAEDVAVSATRPVAVPVSGPLSMAVPVAVRWQGEGCGSFRRNE